MKKTITAITLAIVLSFGTTLANAGIVVVGVSDGSTKTDSCTAKTDKTDWGILVSDIVGILVSDFTGILVSDFGGILVSDFGKDDAPVNCGIIVH